MNSGYVFAALMLGVLASRIEAQGGVVAERVVPLRGGSAIGERVVPLRNGGTAITAGMMFPSGAVHYSSGVATTGSSFLPAGMGAGATYAHATLNPSSVFSGSYRANSATPIRVIGNTAYGYGWGGSAQKNYVGAQGGIRVFGYGMNGSRGAAGGRVR